MEDGVGVYSKLGNILRDQGKLEEAGRYYQKALELRPDLAGPYYNMANVLKDQGRLQDALALYRKAIALDPDYAEAHNNMGNAYKMHYNLKRSNCLLSKGNKPETSLCHRLMTTWGLRFRIRAE